MHLFGSGFNDVGVDAVAHGFRERVNRGVVHAGAVAITWRPVAVLTRVQEAVQLTGGTSEAVEDHVPIVVPTTIVLRTIDVVEVLVKVMAFSAHTLVTVRRRRG